MKENELNFILFWSCFMTEKPESVQSSVIKVFNSSFKLSSHKLLNRFYIICKHRQFLTDMLHTASFLCGLKRMSAIECIRGVISKEYLENYSGNEFNSNVMSYLSMLGKHHLGLSIPVSRSLAGIISQMDKSKTGFVLVGRLRWKP